MTAHAKRLQLLYRITEEEYDRILEYQGGVCAGCLKPPKNQRLAVEHRHNSGLINGLMCMGCNKALGYIWDNPETLRRLADYLENPPATKALGSPRYGLIGRAKVKKVMKYGPG